MAVSPISNQTTSLTSSTGSVQFTEARVNVWLRKELLEIGQRDAVFERFASRSAMPTGLGDTVRWIRYNRLDLPNGTLTEGTTPAESQLGLNKIESTLSQYGVLVAITDKLRIETNHNVLTEAGRQVAETTTQTRDKVAQDALIEGTTVRFAGGAANRAALTSADVITSQDLLSCLNSLETTDGVAGRAPMFQGNTYMFVGHSRMFLDMRADTDLRDSLIRGTPAGTRFEDSPMRSFQWEGFTLVATNFAHEFTNPGLPVTDGLVVTDAPGAGQFAGGVTATVIITAKDKKRQLEEIIYTADSATDAAPFDVSVDFTAATTGRVYNVYTSTSPATARLVDENVEAGATTGIKLYGPGPAAAATPPEALTSGETIYTGYAFGRGAYDVTDINAGRLETGIAPRGRSKFDPLDQKDFISSKWFQAAKILNDNFICRIEAGSAFS